FLAPAFEVKIKTQLRNPTRVEVLTRKAQPFRRKGPRNSCNSETRSINPNLTQEPPALLRIERPHLHPQKHLPAQRLGPGIPERVMVTIKIGDVDKQHLDVSVGVQGPSIASIHTDLGRILLPLGRKQLQMTSLMGIGIKRGSAQEIGIVDEPLRSCLRIQALDVSLDHGRPLRNLGYRHLLAVENALRQFLTRPSSALFVGSLNQDVLCLNA